MVRRRCWGVHCSSIDSDPPPVIPTLSRESLTICRQQSSLLLCTRFGNLLIIQSQIRPLEPRGPSIINFMPPLLTSSAWSSSCVVYNYCLEMGLSRLVVCCSVLLLALSSCFIVDGRLGCNGGVECLRPVTASPDDGNRKVFGMSEEFFKGLKPLDQEVRGDLRWVPSGPDPLHHNGSPKKPQTP